MVRPLPTSKTPPQPRKSLIINGNKANRVLPFWAGAATLSRAALHWLVFMAPTRPGGASPMWLVT